MHLMLIRLILSKNLNLLVAIISIVVNECCWATFPSKPLRKFRRKKKWKMKGVEEEK